MKVPASWLREYVAFEGPVEAVARRLVFSSCEVDRIVRRGVPDEDGNLGRYLVGHVVEAGKHPNADRLQLCQVDVGEGEPRQIVCGAWNFGAGATVAVALPGAVLPGGQRLEQAKLRGEVSNGMILSERELELGADHTGILVLPAEWEAGTPLGDVLPLGDDVLEIETGYNRPDLTAIYGIAREVHALTGAELAPPPGRDPEHGDEPVDVAVEDLERCPRYIGRVFRDVSVGESPPWLKARLLAAGMRPISNVVDVTNYVMLALGSPLHAFDRTRLAEGRIVVRRARARESIRTLDGQVRELTREDLVIADAERPVAIAGVMGGEESEVGSETTEVLLEAANFEQLGVLRTSERLHLRSEASTRWEKGVDPYAAEQAAVYATELFVELCGARFTGHTDVHGGLPERPVVRLRPERSDAVAGLHLPPERQRTTLERLGFDVADDWTVTVPTWRARDVHREIDVVEEVVRFALEEVPSTLPTRQEMFGLLTRFQRLRRLVEDVLVGCGFYEAYTYSLRPDDPDPRALALPEPLSAVQRVLRTTLVYSLVEAARANVDRGNEGVALFEVAHVYLPRDEQLPEERWRVAGIVEGGFFRAKGALETLLDTLHVESRFEPAQHPFMRTQACASLPGGWVAQLDPSLLDGEWGVFELDLEELFAQIPERIEYEDVVAHPAVKQDVALVVSEDVPAGALVAAAREAVGPELREMRPFDVYRGEQIPAGHKSIAFALVFQAPDRTLSDDDAAALRARLVDALRERFDAELRSV